MGSQHSTETQSMLSIAPADRVKIFGIVTNDYYVVAGNYNELKILWVWEKTKTLFIFNIRPPAIYYQFWTLVEAAEVSGNGWRFLTIRAFIRGSFLVAGGTNPSRISEICETLSQPTFQVFSLLSPDTKETQLCYSMYYNWNTLFRPISAGEVK